MRKTGLSVMVLVAMVLGASAQAGPGFRAVPVDEGPGLAAWHANEGVDDHAMHLENPSEESKNPPGSGGEGGAWVIFEGVEGITLSELGFDIRNGETCESDLGPHLFVYTEPAGDQFVFECQKGVRLPSQDDPLNWTRVRFTDVDPYGSAPWPGFGNVVVRSIEMGLLLGRVHLDNFDINGVLIGGPGSHK